MSTEELMKTINTMLEQSLKLNLALNDLRKENDELSDKNLQLRQEIHRLEEDLAAALKIKNGSPRSYW